MTSLWLITMGGIVLTSILTLKDEEGRRDVSLYGIGGMVIGLIYDGMR